jgi:uncharacterized tellurite resistance protein B-like protein
MVAAKFARMFDFLSGKDAPVASKADELELAVAALLVEAARMDDDFSSDERDAIERLLAAKFGKNAVDAQALLEEAHAQVRGATQLFPFTQQICRSLEPPQRSQIIEMLWKVAYADGTLDAQEDMLVRRVAGLIHVPDRERMLARQRALAELGVSDQP